MGRHARREGRRRAEGGLCDRRGGQALAVGGGGGEGERVDGARVEAGDVERAPLPLVVQLDAREVGQGDVVPLRQHVALLPLLAHQGEVVELGVAPFGRHRPAHVE